MEEHLNELMACLNRFYRYYYLEPSTVASESADIQIVFFKDLCLFWLSIQDIHSRPVQSNYWFHIAYLHKSSTMSCYMTTRNFGAT